MQKRDTVFFILNTGDIKPKEERERERNRERCHPYEQTERDATRMNRVLRIRDPVTMEVLFHV